MKQLMAAILFFTLLIAAYGYYIEFPEPGARTSIYAKNLQPYSYFSKCMWITNANWLAFDSKVQQKCSDKQKYFCTRRAHFDPQNRSHFSLVLVPLEGAKEGVNKRYLQFLKQRYLGYIRSCFFPGCRGLEKKMSLLYNEKTLPFEVNNISTFLQHHYKEWYGVYPQKACLKDFVVQKQVLLQGVSERLEDFIRIEAQSEDQYSDEVREHKRRYVIILFMLWGGGYLLYRLWSSFVRRTRQ